MMMRLVSSFAILRVKIVVVRIRTLVPKRRDESPHALSRRLLSLFKVSFKNQQRAQTQRRREAKKERKHKFCERTKAYVERKQNNGEI